MKIEPGKLVKLTQPEALDLLKTEGVLDGADIDVLETSKHWDRGIVFRNCRIRSLKMPDCIFKESLEFHGCEIESADLRGCHCSLLRFNGGIITKSLSARWIIVHGELQIMNSQILGPTDLSESVVSGSAYFLKTHFESELVLVDACFKSKALFSYDAGTINSIENCTAQVREKMHEIRRTPRAAMAKVTKIDATGATFGGKLVFEEVGGEIQKAVFTNAWFQAGATFDKTRFTGEADFRKCFGATEITFCECRFEGDVLFDGAVIGQRLNFDGAKFGCSSHLCFNNLSGCEVSISRKQLLREKRSTLDKLLDLFSLWGRERLILRDAVSNEEKSRLVDEWVTLKRSYSEKQAHEDEDWAQWHLMHERCRLFLDEATSWRDKLLRSPSFLFRSFVFETCFGWGVRPYNILVTSLALIAAFAVFLHFLAPLITPEATATLLGHSVRCVDIGFASAMYISTQTFISFTLGDWQFQGPGEGVLKTVLTLEAVLGILCITFFIVAYTRRILR